MKIIEEDQGWKLLEQITFNDRSLLAWYNPNDGIISLALFHLTDQPNELSKKSPHTNWGFATYFQTAMNSPKEASEVVSLYLKDIKNENYWWEKN